MRKLFFGILISKKAAAPFLSLFKTLTQTYPSLPFSPSEKWHITIHFVGDVTEKAYEVIRENFNQKKLPRISPIILGGAPVLGTFGNSVLFLRVRDEKKGLFELHQILEEMVPVHATRKYSPHVTWARNPKHADLKKIVGENHLALEKEYILGHLILFESLSQKGNTTYVPRAQKKLFLR